MEANGSVQAQERSEERAAQGGGDWHALVWLAWALATMGAVQIATNPLYVAVTMVAIALVVRTAAPPGPFLRAFPVLVALAAVFAGVRVILTALTTRGGPEVWFHLPQAKLPMLLGGFTVGGAVDGEVVVHALAESFVVVGIIAAFAAFNAIVAHHELVRLLPRAFHELGLVITVGLAFVPSTLAAVRDVREAALARGGVDSRRRTRALRMIVPVLDGGLERAVRLAESMDSRGFGHLPPGRADRRAVTMAAVGLGAFAASLAALVGRARPLAALLAAAGIGIVGLAVWSASRSSRRPRHRPRRLTRADLAMIGVLAAVPAALSWLTAAGQPTLRWRAGDGLGFELAVAAVLLLITVPALWRRPRP